MLMLDQFQLNLANYNDILMMLSLNNDSILYILAYNDYSYDLSFVFVFTIFISCNYIFFYESRIFCYRKVILKKKDDTDPLKLKRIMQI